MIRPSDEVTPVAPRRKRASASSPTDPRRERRREPRTDFDATALVNVGNARHVCRILNLAPSGVLLIPPERRGPRTFVRLNLTLPALDGVIDVDGVIAREGLARGFYAWGIDFIEPPAMVVELIRTYIEWYRRSAEALCQPQHKLPSSSAEGLIERAQTGPSYPATVARAREQRDVALLGGSVGASSGRGPNAGARAVKAKRSSLDAADSYEGAELRSLYRRAMLAIRDEG